MGHVRWVGRLTALAIALVASTASAETYYFHNDHLGTPQIATDRTGSVVWEGRYEPFGVVT